MNKVRTKYEQSTNKVRATYALHLQIRATLIKNGWGIDIRPKTSLEVLLFGATANKTLIGSCT